MTHDLTDQVRSILALAAEAYRGSSIEQQIDEIASRLDSPLRVAIAGRVKAGKSTLLNALVGEELAPTDAGECTKIVTWYQYGPTYRVTLDLLDGSSRPARFTRDRGAIEIDLSGVAPADIERIVVEWPISSLREVTLIDTPGVASANEDVSQRAVSFLVPGDDAPTHADAVLYLMRHLHSNDLAFLESFHDDTQAKATPINAIGVLSRADEIGVGRSDAMRSAVRIADRYRTDSKLRRLCQTVLPVAGLLAETGATLMEDEYQALATLSELPRAESDALLLSADRFVKGEHAGSVTPLVRRHLIDRFGMFGVRLALPLIRQGVASSAGELADLMVRRSGITRLRAELMEQFARRRDVLTARSALLALTALLRAVPQPGSDHVASEIERVTAGAHVFAEIRLLNAHRRRSVTFHPDDVPAVERLLGGRGPGAAACAGLAADADPASVRARLLEDIDHWRRRQGSPLTSRDVADAAAILIRTCEGLLAELADAAPTVAPATIQAS